MGEAGESYGEASLPQRILYPVGKFVVYPLIFRLTVRFRPLCDLYGSEMVRVKFPLCVVCSVTNDTITSESDCLGPITISPELS